MATPQRHFHTPDTLRRAAEQRLAAQAFPRINPGLNDLESQRMLHELQVHQIELEMQNAELQMARDEVAALLDEYANLYDFAPVGYLSLDPTGRVLRANLTAADLLGVDRGSMTGVSFLCFLAEESQPIFQAFLNAWNDHRPASSCDLICQSAPGSLRWVRMEAPAGTTTPECRVALVDISERKRAEETLRRFEAELEQTQKMESLGSLAAGVAHDINNVLGAIYATVETQLQFGQLEAPVAHAMHLIATAAERGKKLVGSLTSFSRKALRDPEPINLNALVREEVALLQRSTLQKVAFQMELADPDPCVLGEQSRLAAVLMNLCVNALDAMPQGGTLTVRTQRVSDDQVVLEVLDSGQGMPPQVLARAMDPFFTTKPFGKGTGLGLSTSYATTRAHGGNLILESTPGVGTCVRVQLPLIHAEEPAAPDRNPMIAPNLALSLLLVDDDELIRSSVSALLECIGHTVQALPGGREALDRLANGPAVDLVILDRNMPGMNGLETLDALRRRMPTQPVLLATGHLEATLESALEKDPWTWVIAKPFSLKDIQELLEHIGRSRTPHP